MLFGVDEGCGGGGHAADDDAVSKIQYQFANGDVGCFKDTNGDVDWAIEGPKLKTGLAELNAKFDTQANELGEVRKKASEFDTWKRALQENPETALPALAKEYGLGVALKEPVDADTLIKQLGTDGQLSTDKVVELVKHLSTASRDSILKEMEPTVRAVHHAHLRTEFPDFDAGADGRNELHTQYKAGLIPQDKLLHLAWRGKNFDEAVKVRVEKAEAAKEAEFAKKLADMGLPGGSAGEAGRPKPREGGTLSEKVKEHAEKSA